MNYGESTQNISKSLIEKDKDYISDISEVEIIDFKAKSFPKDETETYVNLVIEITKSVFFIMISQLSSFLLDTINIGFIGSYGDDDLLTAIGLGAFINTLVCSIPIINLIHFFPKFQALNFSNLLIYIHY